MADDIAATSAICDYFLLHKDTLSMYCGFLTSCVSGGCTKHAHRVIYLSIIVH